MKYNTEQFDLKYSRPVPLWSIVLENHEELNKKLLEEIKKYRLEKPENYTDSINVNVWQSNWEMHTRPSFDVLIDTVKDFTKSVAKEYYNFPKFNPDVVDCWVNIYNTDSGCRVHQHFPATFSLVYYISVPEHSGEIYFPDIEASLMPSSGLLLCFRGDLWHGVKFNFTSNDRIIVGINVVHKHS